MSSQYPHLMSPLRIGPVEVRNRMVSTAHATWLGSDFRPTPALAAYHAARAKGGIGLIIMENSRVHPTARGGRAALEAWHEESIPHYRKIAEAVQEHGAKIFAQLIHTGLRTASMDTEQPIWAPSGVRLPWFTEVPHQMSKAEIRELIEWWVRCAVNMKHAGMDGVEIHGAHGFLVAQFISPATNFRTDEYGGSLENRARLPLELAAAVRKAIGRDMALGFRLSADELIPNGLKLDESTQVARWLEDSGNLDYVSISHSVEYDHMSVAQQFADMAWGPMPFVHLAEAVKRAVGDIPIIAACRIIEPSQAEGILRDGKADLVAMTRAHLADPDIGVKILEGRDGEIRQCIGSNQACVGRSNGERHTGCVINPEAGRELELGDIEPAGEPKAVVVVGGGPAGMEAARVAAQRGHLVALYERGERLGGQINTLAKAPLRHEFGNIVAWMELQLRRLGVVVKLNSEATLESIRTEGAECVIVATGSLPHLPEIAGANGHGPRVVTVDDILERRVPLGKRALLLDDDNTFRAASAVEFLVDAGVETHYAVRAEGANSIMHPTMKPPINKRLGEKGVLYHRFSRIQEVRGGDVILVDNFSGAERVLEGVDTIVTTAPNRPDTALYDALTAEDGALTVLMAGDCVAPRQVAEAIREGHLAGRSV